MLSQVSEPPASQPASASQPKVYYLVWRSRPSHPWHSEELYSRIEAHNKYFALIQRGVEAYLERRSPGILPAQAAQA